jgi:hypothetical protein
MSKSEASKWELRFLELAHHVATWSRDPSTKVGCVIVDQRNRVLGMGYNGFPRGVLDLPERYADRPTKLSLTVHSEPNAILNSSGELDGASLFCTLAPWASAPSSSSRPASGWSSALRPIWSDGSSRRSAASSCSSRQAWGWSSSNGR